jgi:serine protease Do
MLQYGRIDKTDDQRDAVGLDEGIGRRKPALRWALAFLGPAVVAGALSGALVSVTLDKGDSSTTSRGGSLPRGVSGDVFAETTAFVLPGVVTIINEQPPRPDNLGRLVENVSVGSGVIVDQRGFVVTNEHVVRGMGKLTVVLNDGVERPATLVSHDAPFTDLAVLRIQEGGFKALRFGDSDTLALGQSVVAIGSALFEYRNSVTIGVISGLHRRWLREGIYMEDLVQTDAAINAGNSGGPLVSLDGEVVGLTTNVVRRLGPAENVYGIAFAISSNTMEPIVRSIIQRGQFPRPYFGVEHQDIDADFLETYESPVERGALVRRVFERSPAQAAGLRAGDVILRIGRTEINEEQTFLNALARVGVNERVPVQFWRGGSISEVLLETTPR